MNDLYIYQIREDIVDAIIMADATDAVDSWLAESQIMLSGHPVDPAYSVFSEFYELAERLRKEYLPAEIALALQQFPYQQQKGLLAAFEDFSGRKREIKIIEYCLRAIEEKKDLETAFRKWID